MSYGNGDANEQKRAVDLGVVGTRASTPWLFALREEWIDSLNAFCEAAWSLDSFSPPPLPAGEHEPLLAVQAARLDRLGTIWAETARTKVQGAVAAQRQSAKKMFAGRLCHLGGAGCLRDDLLFDLYDEVGSDEILALAEAASSDAGGLWSEAAAHATSEARPDARGEALAWLHGAVAARFGTRPLFAANDDFVAAIPVTEKCLSGKANGMGFEAVMTQLAAQMREAACAKRPVVRPLALGAMVAGGAPMPIGVLSKDSPANLVITVPPRPIRALAPTRIRDDDARFAAWVEGLEVGSLTVEIGPNAAHLKAIVRQPEGLSAAAVEASAKALDSAQKALERGREKAKALADGTAVLKPGEKAPNLDRLTQRRDAARARADRQRGGFCAALGAAKAVLGIDTGKTATLAFGVLDAPFGVDPAKALALAANGKAGATKAERDRIKTWLSTHALPNPNVLAEAQLNAEPLIARLKQMSAQTAKLSSRVEINLSKLSAHRSAVNRLLGRSLALRLPERFEDLLIEPAVVWRLETGLVPPEHVGLAFSAFCAFWRRMRRTNACKAERKDTWRRIRAIVDCWQGFCTNLVVRFAQALEAVVAVEESDWGIQEKGGSDYWGRDWNRIVAMLAPARLRDTLSAKLDWSGLAHWGVASPHTSQNDFRFGVVHPAQRPKGGKDFTALADLKVWDADIHAGTGVAAQVLMEPMDAAQLARRDQILRDGPKALREANRQKTLAEAARASSETVLVSDKAPRGLLHGSLSRKSRRSR